MSKRVVVTGIGLISAVGNDTPTTWQALLAGQSGVGPITRFDASDQEVRIAAELKGFDPAPYLDRKEIRRNDPFVHYAMAATRQAMDDARFTVTEENADDVGVI
ncbi:MAG TPA: beta-ketoacyl synthase N-terminal-like domain-containing protein, partial [Ktedonobacterales bacterium]|nr:beta-ketoacyl synthase N-terminal-like domain-containing protein [Ktedonobacterales bacterium]